MIEGNTFAKFIAEALSKREDARDFNRALSFYKKEFSLFVGPMFVYHLFELQAEKICSPLHVMILSVAWHEGHGHATDWPNVELCVLALAEVDCVLHSQLIEH